MSSPLRAIALKLHLFLGLTAGTVIATCCLTGAALVFEPEITRMLHPEWTHVEGSGSAVTVKVALDSVVAALPGAKVLGVTVTNDPARPWDLQTDQGVRALVDPYTGHVVALAPFRLPFFQKAMEIHRWLLADDVGEWITGAATLMFVFLLIFGLIIWWPRTKGALKARINPFAVFSKHGGGRRKLHDLHVALGIWCWPILFFLALSAMPLAYDWAGSLINYVTGVQRGAPPPKSGGDSTAATLPYDSLVALARATFPDARTWSVRPPQRANGAVSLVSVAANDPSDRHIDIAYADRLTGAILRTDRWADMGTGMHIRRMMEWWHTGRAWGVPLRTLWFLAVLFGASFPLTGFLMYRAGKRA
ncbi:MAG TPA: PepSY-associated TM helix domain-containing protein [Gemmatimonadales bacterium]|nr:PepSY-associated TM helix domain-containing protein [Gemmatimonadales bacterium]